jgi:hypothetical protein
VSPNAPGTYNDVVGNVTIGATGALVPGEDHMVDFSSEGPAHPSASARCRGPGRHHVTPRARTVPRRSGTSMSATSRGRGTSHRAPSELPPAKIKALIMNQATRRSPTSMDVARPGDGWDPVASRPSSPSGVVSGGPGSLSFRPRAASDLMTIVDVHPRTCRGRRTRRARAATRILRSVATSASRLATAATSHDSLRAGGR